MSHPIELKTLAAHLTKAPPHDVIAVRFRDDGSISVVINPGKKLYFTPEQIARATAELSQPAPGAAAPPPAAKTTRPEPDPRGYPDWHGDAEGTPPRPILSDSRRTRHTKL
jgi:hypothetical protein